jgi:HSP20 family protein
MANIVRKTAPSNLAPGYAWDPFEAMREMMNWDPFRAMPLYPTHAPALAFAPQFEVKETPDAYVFMADLPGVDEKDVDITLSGNRLTVSGRREAEEREEGESYYAYERSYGSFTRSFTLPEGIDQSGLGAEMKNGVLTVRLPKQPEHKPKKISVGGGIVDKVKQAITGGSGKEKGKA